MRQTFIFSLVGLNMQVLTLAASFDFMAKQGFTADGCSEESVSVGGMRTRMRFFSLSLFTLF